MAVCQFRLHQEEPPKITIWSWDYPQDLTFVRPQTADIAYYAGTAYLRGANVFFRPRTKELKVADGVHVYPVLRIESDGRARPDTALYEQIVPLVSELQSRHKADKIQIDFDARQSERPFYSELLKNLSKSLGHKAKLEITALASWCTVGCGENNWLDQCISGDLRCEPPVLMLFSMGPGSDAVLPKLNRSKISSIGLSVAEHRTNRLVRKLGYLKAAGRIFVFNPRPWTEESWLAIQEELKSNEVALK